MSPIGIKPPDFGKLNSTYISEQSQPSQKWSIKQGLDGYASNSNGSQPSFSLNFGDVVAANRIYYPPNAGDLIWSEITRTSYIQIGEKWVPQTKTGWVLDLYLDDYNEGSPNNIVKIENPTPNPNDAKQYMMWDGTKQEHMCGELCVAYIVKNEIDISLESVLERWRKTWKSADA